MKLEIEMSKAEAQRLIGCQIKQQLLGTLSAGLQVTALDWSSYGTRITITLEAPREEVTEQRAGEPA